MKTGMTVLGVVAVAALALFAFYMVDIDQTQEGALPTISVDVDAGQLPEFDADVGEINLGTTQVEVTVPEVEIKETTATISLPTLSVEPPAEDGVADN